MGDVREITLTPDDCVLRAEAIVGESPVWHARQNRLYWVDIQGKTVNRFDPLSGTNESKALPEIVTSFAFRDSGGMLLTLRSDFAVYDFESGTLERIPGPERDRKGNRFNDGKCDRQGRFWAGTMDEARWDFPGGSLYRLGQERDIKLMQKQVVCSNGMGWSPDSKTMYHTESFRYAIYAFDFDPDTGELANRRTFASVDPGSGSFPDGLTVDREGFVWSAQVGRGQVVRYDPAGRPERRINLPVPRVTSCVFGGRDQEVLYMTSARETMSPAQISQATLSGSLFGHRPGVWGLPEAFYTG